MISRLRDSAVFATILAVIVLGLLQASPWSALAGGCILTTIGIVRKRAPVGIAAFGSVRLADAATVAGATLNGAAIASGAYLYGRACGWMLGF